MATQPNHLNHILSNKNRFERFTFKLPALLEVIGLNVQYNKIIDRIFVKRPLQCFGQLISIDSAL